MIILLCFVYTRHCVGAVALYMLLLFEVERKNTSCYDSECVLIEYVEFNIT